MTRKDADFKSIAIAIFLHSMIRIVQLIDGLLTITPLLQQTVVPSMMDIEFLLQSSGHDLGGKQKTFCKLFHSHV
jgi:hypothetical protein